MDYEEAASKGAGVIVDVEIEEEEGTGGGLRGDAVELDGNTELSAVNLWREEGKRR